jgi:hypothetical protein
MLVALTDDIDGSRPTAADELNVPARKARFGFDFIRDPRNRFHSSPLVHQPQAIEAITSYPKHIEIPLSDNATEFFRQAILIPAGPGEPASRVKSQYRSGSSNV